MKTMEDISTRFTQFLQSHWFGQLQPRQEELLRLSVELLQREQRMQTKWVDYSFILFPSAKAYEGFLKDFLLRHELITPAMHDGRKFRIGRALNPDMREEQKDEWWLYDDVVKLCSENVACEIWNTWIECRNQVFHFFPKSDPFMSILMAEKKLQKVFHIIEKTMSCVLDESR